MKKLIVFMIMAACFLLTPVFVFAQGVEFVGFDPETYVGTLTALGTTVALLAQLFIAKFKIEKKWLKQTEVII